MEWEDEWTGNTKRDKVTDEALSSAKLVALKPLALILINLRLYYLIYLDSKLITNKNTVYSTVHTILYKICSNFQTGALVQIEPSTGLRCHGPHVPLCGPVGCPKGPGSLVGGGINVNFLLKSMDKKTCCS